MKKRARNGKITEINHPECERIRDAVDAALKETGERLGMTFRAGNMSYDPDGLSVTIKLAGSVDGEDGEAVDPMVQEFKRHCDQFDLRPDHLGKEIKLEGTTFRIVGLKPRSPKFPIIGQRVSDGKRFKLPLKGVQIVLGIAFDLKD